MRSIRAGMGLGDALYLQSVARHLVKRGEKVKVMTAWPDVFKPLNGSVECQPFTRAGVDLVAHYTTRKGIPGTSQFEDCCLNARLDGPVELKLEWPVRPSKLVTEIRMEARGRPVVLVQLMRSPMNRKDKFGASLLPDGKAMQKCIDRLKDRCYLVQVGSGPSLYELQGLHRDLANQTEVDELLDVAANADGFLGYVSFFIPLAESLGKPALMVWSSKGLRDAVAYVRQITPEKVIHRKDLVRVVMDDAKDIEGAADAFLR